MKKKSKLNMRVVFWVVVTLLIIYNVYLGYTLFIRVPVTGAVEFNPVVAEGDAIDRPFFYAAGPGDVIEDDLFLLNQTGETIHAELDLVDANIDDTDTFAPGPSNADDVEVGSWGTLDKTSSQLDHGEREEIHFTLNIPEDIPAGDYWGAVAMIYEEGELVDGPEAGTSVMLVSRHARKILIRVTEDQEGVEQLDKMSTYEELSLPAR